MNFTFPEGRVPQKSPPVEIGNVYASKNTHKTVAWVVVQVSGRTVHLLGVDAEGEISTTQSYNLHSFETRPLIGKVDLSTLSFDIIPAEEDWQ